MGAQEAAQHGLVNRVVPMAELLASARELAAAVVANAPLSIAAMLDIGRRTAHMDPIEAMSAIKQFESYRTAIDSEDAAEGNLSFTESARPSEVVADDAGHGEFGEERSPASGC
jgi:enoyl-CoA hydratase/carnithine racemase